MPKLGPKCQYFVWPPLFSSTALTLLGMEFTRASQVCHCSPLPLLHDDITELVDVRDLALLTFCLRMTHRCSIGFRSGDMLDQSITFTLSFFSKAVVVIMLKYCPVSEGRGSCSASVCHSTCWHSWFPSMNCSSPVPAALMQPQTMTHPSP